MNKSKNYCMKISIIGGILITPLFFLFGFSIIECFRIIMYNIYKDYYYAEHIRLTNEDKKQIIWSCIIGIFLWIPILHDYFLAEGFC